jgi:exonuclease III
MGSVYLVRDLTLDREVAIKLCLQELKATDAHFPHEAVRAAGYDGAVLGQKPGAIDRVIGSICRRRKSRRPSPTPR